MLHVVLRVWAYLPTSLPVVVAELEQGMFPSFHSDPSIYNSADPAVSVSLSFLPSVKLAYDAGMKRLINEWEKEGARERSYHNRLLLVAERTREQRGRRRSGLIAKVTFTIKRKEACNWIRWLVPS